MTLKRLNDYRFYLVRKWKFEVYKYGKNHGLEKVTGRHAAVVDDIGAWN